MKVARPFVEKTKWSDAHRRVALLAALLHDLGHGPFSHAFELAEQERLRGRPGTYRHHEAWTADIIQSPDGNIRSVLRKEFLGDGAIADDIASLLSGTPHDIYAAVVSSSFDADRLDYLQRDKLMTGSGAGGIDFDWLRDNLRIAKVRDQVDGPADPSALEVETFCFTEKATQAAEAFLLARYHLFSQVYFHKTTRGFEQLLTAFLKRLATLVESGRGTLSGLPQEHGLVKYYASEKPTLDQYAQLDDVVVWSAVTVASNGGDETLRTLSGRLLHRVPMRPVEIDLASPTKVDRARRKKIDELMNADGGKSIFVDRPKLSAYADHRREAVPLHKRVHIQRNDGAVADIATLSGPIASLLKPREILRYYFLDESVREDILAIGG